MSIPQAAWEKPEPYKVKPLGDALPSEGDAYILNSYFDIQFLTTEQALDLINTLSGSILADHNTRSAHG